MLYYVMASSQTLGDALKRVARYRKITNEARDLGLTLGCTGLAPLDKFRGPLTAEWRICATGTIVFASVFRRSWCICASIPADTVLADT